MDKRIFRISLTAALAGFLFGFDTVVISGANQPIKDLWGHQLVFGRFNFHLSWHLYYVHGALGHGYGLSFGRYPLR